MTTAAKSSTVVSREKVKEATSHAFTRGVTPISSSFEEGWLEDEVDQQYLKFTEKKDVSIFMGTWNVNSRTPKSVGDDLADYLLLYNSDDTCLPGNAERAEHLRKELNDDIPSVKAFGRSHRRTASEKLATSTDEVVDKIERDLSTFDPDIYVLGFQEVVDLNATTLYFEHRMNVEWESAISRVLGGDERFVCIVSQTLVGILLLIYVRNDAELISNIDDILVKTTGVGVFGSGGNKGAVCARMRIYDSTVCFVCTHLAAHKGNVQGRNDNYAKIIETTRFAPSVATPPLSAAESFEVICQARAMASASTLPTAAHSAAAASTTTPTSTGSQRTSDFPATTGSSEVKPKPKTATDSGEAKMPGSGLLAAVSPSLTSTKAPKIPVLKAVATGVGAVVGEIGSLPSALLSASGVEDSAVPAAVASKRASSMPLGVASALALGSRSTLAETLRRRGGPSLDIMAHDIVFWFGDLNYRLNMSDLSLVYELMRVDASGEQRVGGGKNADYLTLLLNDQLINERSARHAFAGFEEATVLFPPTYKFEKDSGRYDRKAGGKMRFPAWTDRIQWAVGSRTHTAKIDDVRVLKYASNTSLKMSDHRSVFSLMKLSANRFDADKRAAVRKQVYKRKDEATNDSLPKIRYTEELSIFEVKYGEPSTVLCEIENVGSFPFEFEVRFMSEAPQPQWLVSVSPTRRRVLPSKKVAVQFTVNVTAQCVAEITRKFQNNMTCVAIISVGKQGIDKFVTLTATYLPSVFGSRIEDLIHYRLPIRLLSAGPSVSVTAPKTGAVTTTASTFAPSAMEDQYPAVLSIPKELWRLVDHIYANGGMQVESMFITRGKRKDLQEIRECLDTGKSFGAVQSMRSFGESLVRLLESFEDAVLPLDLATSVDCSTASCRKLLMALPLSHYNVFIYTVSFLKEVLRFSTLNKLTVDKLAYQFASCLTQSQPHKAKDLKKYPPFLLLKHFLTSAD